MKASRILALSVLLAFTRSQLTQLQQNHLSSLADDQLLNEKATLRGVAQSGLILSSLNQLNEYAQVHGCRIANKIAINSDSESPATIYYKAEIYRYFRCETFKEVSSEITELL